MAYRPKDVQERITHRLKIVQGHLKKVLQMVEADKYCIDIIHQSQAIQKALKEIDNLMLENHLESCAAKVLTGQKHQQMISEIVEVFRKSH